MLDICASDMGSLVLSKRISKFIKSLHIKKFRKQESAFLLEGEKNILELVNTDYDIIYLLLTTSFYERNTDIFRPFEEKIIVVDESFLITHGTFGSNTTGMAVVRIPNVTLRTKGMVIGLDGIRDPGNLGTIIRIADWFGVKQIICSLDCADVYNPKVINSTMGSFSRVSVIYCDLPEFLSEHKKEVYGAVMQGEVISDMKFDADGILIIGNESTGIRDQVLRHINHPVTIPGYGGAESLNAAVATGIICHAWKVSD